MYTLIRVDQLFPTETYRKPQKTGKIVPTTNKTYEAISLTSVVDKEMEHSLLIITHIQKPIPNLATKVGYFSSFSIAPMAAPETIKTGHVQADMKNIDMKQPKVLILL